MFLDCYRVWRRLRDRAFSVAAGRAFAAFGRGSVIQLPARISGEQSISIGEDVLVGADSWLQALGAGELVVGSGTRMSGHCVVSAATSVRIGRDVLIARGVHIADHNHAHRDSRLPVLAQGIADLMPVCIERGAWLGQNAVVLPGVTIGERAVVGANAVVTRDVPAHAIAAGVPARLIGEHSPARSPRGGESRGVREGAAGTPRTG